MITVKLSTLPTAKLLSMYEGCAMAFAVSHSREAMTDLALIRIEITTSHTSVLPAALLRTALLLQQVLVLSWNVILTRQKK